MLLLCLLGASALLLHAEGRRAEATVTHNNNGHALDNDKWLSTVSQYDKDRYWNKFRDVSVLVSYSLRLFWKVHRSRECACSLCSPRSRGSDVIMLTCVPNTDQVAYLLIFKGTVHIYTNMNHTQQTSD